MQRKNPVISILVVFIAISIITAVRRTNDSEEPSKKNSAYHSDFYKHGAVASETQICSKIGVDVMKNNGTAVDAAIATMFCQGVIRPELSGIGGGGFMLVYQRSKKEVKFFDFRETAPGASKFDMFVNRPGDSTKGKLSVAVPGEISGMYYAWKLYGKLPWQRLIQPAIDLATKGHKLYAPTISCIALGWVKKELLKDESLREIFYHKDGSPRKLGETITDPIFGKTLTEISRDPFSFYNGSIAKEIVKDIQERGGILTEDDLKNYRVKDREVLVSSMTDDDKLYTSTAPSSGPTLIMILNILKGYNFGPDSLSDKNIVNTWHRILEAFKFGYAYRQFLGDPSFDSNVKKSVRLQVDAFYAEELRKMIWDNTTHNSNYYGGFHGSVPDYGTAHISVLSPSGDAVSVTTTIGTHFGAKIRSKKTGIVYNNHMSTYGPPEASTSPDERKSSRANNIVPGKRSVSTACPAIVVNKDGSVKMVVGGSGGMWIPTEVPTVLINKLWIGLSLNESISSPRLHHQLYPNKFIVEPRKIFRMKQTVIDGLHALGHKSDVIKRNCAVQGIYRDKKGNIYAMSDPRKGGVADGF